jgi:hypothetical protein
VLISLAELETVVASLSSSEGIGEPAVVLTVVGSITVVVVVWQNNSRNQMWSK